ncbi:thioredoxin [Backusella circina FSU 941]|nr:thioredoxin [Backusella circina FSU 941]
MSLLRTVALKTALKPRSQFIRSFSVGQPCFTGKTVEGTNETFDALVTNADHPVIVDFYADWCGPCKIIAPVLSKSVAANPKVTLVKINVDEHQELAQKYQVTALPTVQAFNGSKVVDKFIGALSGVQIEKFVKKHASLA